MTPTHPAQTVRAQEVIVDRWEIARCSGLLAGFALIVERGNFNREALVEQLREVSDRLLAEVKAGTPPTSGEER